jgi:hypothetical protein
MSQVKDRTKVPSLADFGGTIEALIEELIIRSSPSGDNCVGVKIGDAGVAVVDTKNPGSPHFYSHDEWSYFIAGVKAGDFDNN